MDSSVFEIFKVGPGPSSSHTIGPMKAAFAFLKRLEALPDAILSKASAIKVELYGSLADTGEGHGTGRAVLAGLSGMEPETCDTSALAKLSLPILVKAGAKALSMDESSVEFKRGPHKFQYQNTLRFLLLDASAALMLDMEAYSIGGGFVKLKGEPEAPFRPVPWPFRNMRDLRGFTADSGLSLPEIVAENEIALSGMDRAALESRLDFVLDAMDASVERGLKEDGLLPGSLGLSRKAKGINLNASKLPPDFPGRFMALLDSYAFAASEENAAGGRVVTAPTSGSSGVIPAVARALAVHAGLSRESIRKGLLSAGAVAGIARMNASISGAEVGCQGEVGVASAMAAAMIAQAHGAPLRTLENAAETALEHHLGLTCDPVGGYVQIPCIERNAVGAVHAWNAYMIAATVEPGRHKLGFDEVLEAMRQTGRDMSLKYKESSRGGLAVCAGRC